MKVVKDKMLFSLFLYSLGGPGPQNKIIRELEYFVLFIFVFVYYLEAPKYKTKRFKLFHSLYPFILIFLFFFVFFWGGTEERNGRITKKQEYRSFLPSFCISKIFQHTP